jgi:hypothetical protein
VVVALVAIQQTQQRHQIVLPNRLVMGIIEWQLVQWNMSITTIQPTIEVAIICVYCQQVGHEFKNYPSMDDKLKKLMRKKFRTSL